MAAKISAEDLAKFPPEIQKQILAELTPPPAPETPKEWYQIGGTRPAPHATQPAPRSAEQPRRTQPSRSTQPVRTAPKPVRRPHKSYLWLYILVAYILLISACLLPGLLMKP
jgi:hypothetical protein